MARLNGRNILTVVRTAYLNVDDVYPVGAVYISADSTSPASLFGGTWERIQDTFLLAAGSTYAAGATGGEATHTLTENEIASHKHYLSLRNAEGAAGGAGFVPADSKAFRSIVWNGGGISPTGTGGFTDRAATDVSDWTFIENTGGGQAHNNMPPYKAVYVWKRTA